jgi:hypothetical protein
MTRPAWPDCPTVALAPKAFVPSSLNAPSKQTTPAANAHRRRPILGMRGFQEFMPRLQELTRFQEFI